MGNFWLRKKVNEVTQVSPTVTLNTPTEPFSV